MKYLLTLDGESLDEKVARRFGHATCYLVADTDSSTSAVFHGDVEQMDHHGLDRFAEMGLAGVITGNVGPHAWEDMQARGLQVFIARGQTGRAALAAVATGQITAATGPTVKKSANHDHHQ